MLERLKKHASPPMIVAIIALVFATTGSAIAAKQLITGRDIARGTITSSNLARSARRSLAGPTGRRGPAGAAGADGLLGPQGPPGSAGERGPQGPKGDTGAQGERGLMGPTGAQGATGARGLDGAQGPQGSPGQALIASSVSAGAQLTTATALGDDAPLTEADGLELLNGSVALESGVIYKVDVRVQASNPNGRTGTAYGVARLFIDGASQITVTTPPIPEDAANVAEASASVIVTGGGTFSLRSAVRSADFSDANVVGDVIVTRIG